MVPKAEAFNLLGKEKSMTEKKRKNHIPRAITHLKCQVTFNVMIEDIDINTKEIPPEIINHIK